MITRMELLYRSVLPTSVTPAIFSSGSYTAIKDGLVFSFDFVYSKWTYSHKDGFLYVNCLLKEFDDDAYLPQHEVDSRMRRLTKSDFKEIFYECFANENETGEIKLTPLEMTFYDYSFCGDGKPMEVLGDAFDNLMAA